MKIYDLLNTNKTLLAQLKRNGLLTATVFQHINIYQDFKAMSGGKEERYEKLAPKYNLSPLYIQKIITKLSKKAR